MGRSWEMSLEKWTTAASSWKNINAKFSSLIKKNLSIYDLSLILYLSARSCKAEPYLGTLSFKSLIIGGNDQR